MFPRLLPALAGAALALTVTAGGASAAVAAPALPTAPAATSAGAPQWSVAPANADGPDGRISLRHTVDPGGSVTDAVAVTNLGSEPTSYTVAPGDGILGDDGAFDIAAGDPNDAGAWVSIEGLDAGTLTLGSGETRVLPVRVDVPADVTPGDHPAGIVVGVSRSESGVTVTNRIGVRLHLQVAGEITAALTATEVTSSFRSSWIPFAPGVLRVETRVSNVGNVRLGALTAVTGGVIDTASSGTEPVELLPGDAANVVTETTAWPVFALFGTTTVRPVVLGDDAIAAPTVTELPFVAPAVSWSGLAALVILVGTVVIVTVQRRRRDHRGASIADAGAPSAPEGTRVEAGAR
ncbi:hypothetical protein NS220_04860 [Microbacterium testaceum]|uniref:DUF916 domain-containing protein n=1 Tax=Microbacterium testaceum TaxID=2033 RepID=A0A147EZA8_MICTE|nr:hypothetical protein [Microbacterium testaceum]KTR95755.1 hypothetical protein NS220_04860 [Microbacterium testaceum]